MERARLLTCFYAVLAGLLGHIQGLVRLQDELRQGRMSREGRDPNAAGERECTRCQVCHFLHVREPGDTIAELFRQGDRTFDGSVR